MAKIDFDTSGFDNMMNDLRSLSFDVECPGCRKSFSVSVRDVGSTVTCPNCGSTIKIESEQFLSKLDSSFNRPVELFCFFPNIADTSHKFLVSFQLDLCCLSFQDSVFPPFCPFYWTCSVIHYSMKYSMDTPKQSARILSLSILGLLLPRFQSDITD